MQKEQQDREDEESTSCCAWRVCSDVAEVIGLCRRWSRSGASSLLLVDDTGGEGFSALIIGQGKRWIAMLSNGTGRDEKYGILFEP